MTGGLAFSPADITDLTPGDVLRWTNADSVARHTATEEHGLWDLELGPGEVRERLAEAGTHRYRCRIHPEMRGTHVVTPFGYSEVRPERVRRRVRIKRPRGKRRHRYVYRTVFRSHVRAIWAQAGGARFDVERRLVGGRYEPWLSATRETSATFRASAGQTWEVRARLRGDGGAVEWSPPVVVRVD